MLPLVRGLSKGNAGVCVKRDFDLFLYSFVQVSFNVIASVAYILNILTALFVCPWRWPSQELLPAVRPAPSHPGSDLVSHTDRKWPLAEQTDVTHSNIISQVTNSPSFVLNLFFQGPGRHEQRWPHGHPWVLYRHEADQAQAAGSPPPPLASSQYETAPPSPTATVWLR